MTNYFDDKIIINIMALGCTVGESSFDSYLFLLKYRL